MDLKLGLIMVVGTVAGVEAGAQAIEARKRRANIDEVVGVAFVIVWTIRWRREREAEMSGVYLRRLEAGEDESAFGHVAEKIQRFQRKFRVQPSGY